MIKFWQRHPALLYGISFYLGCSLQREFSLSVLIPIIIFIISIASFDKVQKARFLLAILVGAVSFFYAGNLVKSMPAGKTQVAGRGIVEVESSYTKQYFGNSVTKYLLNIHSFSSFDKSINLRNISCRLVLNVEKGTLKGGVLYEISGLLEQKSSNLRLKPNFEILRECGNRFSFVNTRTNLQKSFKKLTSAFMPQGEARAFLEGIFSGDLQADFLVQHIRKLGLHHIIVVSGFHFSIVAGCMGFILRLIFPLNLSYIGMLLGCTFYFIFVGPSPSVLRAYISAMIFVCAKLFRRETSGLNAFGVGLLVVLLYNPTFCGEVGFQLSFLATLAILLLYSHCDLFLKKIFLTRSDETISIMSYSDRALYSILTFFRSSWALNLSVNIMVIPTILFLFQSFPLISIIYNMFFPFLVSLAMMPFLLSFIFSLIPYIGAFLFSCTHSFTSWILSYVNHVPEQLNYKIEANIPEWVIGFYLSLVIFLAIKLQGKSKETIFDNI